MALFELEQNSGSDPETEWKAPTFEDCAAADIDPTFFEQDEHADLHTVDGKEALVIVDDQRLKEHNSHWETGAKQNFGTGLYTASTVLYIRVRDYGPKPKIGKYLIMGKGTSQQRTCSILDCEEETGIYRITMERMRQ